MKYCAAFLLVCLLLTGVVSAASLSPVSVGAIKTINSTPQITKIATLSAPAAIGTKETVIFVKIDSTPTGAKIAIDGASSGATTPFNQGLKPGVHTIVLSRDLYQDYTVTLDLKAGMEPQYITADLKRVVIGSGTFVTLKETMGIPTNPIPLSTMGTFPSETTGKPAVLRTIDQPVTLRTVVTTTLVPMACPNSDWSCLTPAEAGQQFGYPNARYGDEPCGYAQTGNDTITKYCYMDVPSSGTLTPKVLEAPGITEGDSIFIQNETGIQHGVVNISPAVKEAANANPIQSFINFFTNIFGGSKKPESQLTISGFAPQPEPPKVPQVANAQGQ